MIASLRGRHDLAAEAYRVEYELIGQFHKEHTGQPWNTIDERFLAPRFLPEQKAWVGTCAAVQALPGDMVTFLGLDRLRPIFAPGFDPRKLLPQQAG